LKLLAETRGADPLCREIAEALAGMDCEKWRTCCIQAGTNLSPGSADLTHFASWSSPPQAYNDVGSAPLELAAVVIQHFNNTLFLNKMNKT